MLPKRLVGTCNRRKDGDGSGLRGNCLSKKWADSGFRIEGFQDSKKWADNFKNERDLPCTLLRNGFYFQVNCSEGKLLGWIAWHVVGRHDPRPETHYTWSLGFPRLKLGEMVGSFKRNWVQLIVKWICWIHLSTHFGLLWMWKDHGKSKRLGRELNASGIHMRVEPKYWGLESIFCKINSVLSNNWLSNHNILDWSMPVRIESHIVPLSFWTY